MSKFRIYQEFDHKNKFAYYTVKRKVGKSWQYLTDSSSTMYTFETIDDIDRFLREDKQKNENYIKEIEI